MNRRGCGRVGKLRGLQVGVSSPLSHKWSCQRLESPPAWEVPRSCPAQISLFAHCVRPQLNHCQNGGHQKEDAYAEIGQGECTGPGRTSRSRQESSWGQKQAGRSWTQMETAYQRYLETIWSVRYVYSLVSCNFFKRVRLALWGRLIKVTFHKSHFMVRNLTDETVLVIRWKDRPTRKLKLWFC